MWARIATILLGLWLMAAPAILDYGGMAAKNGRIVGPLAVSFGIIAISEATRPARWVNVPLAIWLLLAPWLFDYGTVPLLNSLGTGLALLPLAFVAGQIKERFGGGWSALWRKEGVFERDD